jgi:hypothetical protein
VDRVRLLLGLLVRLLGLVQGVGLLLMLLGVRLLAGKGLLLQLLQLLLLCICLVLL